MRKLLLVSAALLALLAMSASASADMALNSEVNSENIDENICISGWTRTVRPPVSFTNEVKKGLLEKLGLPWSSAEDFELDHIVPLTLGGHPSSPDNLELQAWAKDLPGWSGPSQARVKDALEVRLKRLVCAGDLELDEAQRCIYDDWRACNARYPSNNRSKQ